MAADVQEFYDGVSSLINRGTTYDSLIPEYAARALRFLETNYTFDYMKVRDSDYHDIVVDVREYEYPELIKKFIDWEYTLDSGEIVHMKKVLSTDVTEVDEADPQGYYSEANLSLWLDSTPAESYAATLWYYAFTDWSEVELGDLPWMVENGEGLFRVQTVLLMAPKLRDAKLMRLLEEEKKEWLRIMSLSAEELEAGDVELQMEYD